MKIAIDESGSFAYSGAENSWNCVAAYVYPEIHNRRIQEEVRKLVRCHAEDGRKEVKLRDLTEDEYMGFLYKLKSFDGVLYAVSTDAAVNTPEIVNHHQSQQVLKILEHVDKMIYESGRESVRNLARRVEQLPHQLYVQMVCQVGLVIQILMSGILYFVQRYPQTLSRFRWRIDQKNSTPTSYEEAYSQVLPALLQSASIREPMPMLEDANYRWFERFYFPEGDEPTYLRDTYGIETNDSDDRKLNIGQVVREDVRFVDSTSDAGVQVADLLASGLRRCLRGQFEDNQRVASLLGSLMVQREHNKVPVPLISLGKDARDVRGYTYSALSVMRASSRAMRVR